MEEIVETAAPLTTATYPAFKNSGVEWLGEIPAHWEVRRLKNVCEMLVSNVDKHTKPSEFPVKLCNYVDVYKNDFITSEISFMQASATKEEIKRFSLKIDDVIITKDSEDWLDIGVPAYVKHEEENLVCGYHLAILRPNEFLKGSFLHRALLSQSVRTQFSVKANGVTRYGISHGAILGTFIAVPPLEEQIRIAEFLDRKTAQVDNSVLLKEKQIELLKEHRQILIHRAVTRGLNPDVPFKNSGVEWIGEIPAHWAVRPLRYIGKCQNGVSKGAEFFKTGYPFVSYSDAYKNISLPENVEGVFQSTAEERLQYSVREGDVFFTRTSETIEEIGFTSVCLKTIPNAGFSGFLIRFRPEAGILHKEFSKYYFTSKTHRAFFVKEMNLVIRASLSQDLLKKMPVILPPVQEQIAIAQFLNDTTQKTATAILLKEKEIQKLKEYKATLINSAVTGKIKV